ncbi:MAG: hypothetical protein H6732_14630 [Alphaproteobacteria bacterium]|nr:hypothetical protein [Alphaproteobacteria bacterium]
MDANAKVELTETWWKANKAKTLKDSAKLGPALKTYETALKALGAAKGPAKAQGLGNLKSAVTALEAARAATSKKCGVLQGDTKKVLDKQFKKAVSDATKDVDKQLKKFDDKLGTLTSKAILGDRTLRTMWIQYSDDPWLIEYHDWLVEVYLGGKRNEASYRKFIPQGASRQINIDSGLRQRFDDVAAQGGDLTDDGLWDKLETAVFDVLATDGHFTHRFRDWTWKRAGFERKALGLR